MKIIKYVQLDAKDQRPTTEFPARHGAVDPLQIEQVITRTTERVRGYDHSVFVGATSADIDTAVVRCTQCNELLGDLLKLTIISKHYPKSKQGSMIGTVMDCNKPNLVARA